MRTGLLHIILLLCTLCLGCISCTDNTEPTSDHIDDGQLRIIYRIAGGAATRVDTEQGWNGNWNENMITRLDLFVFEENGALHKHIPIPDLTVEDKQDDTYTLLETDELTYADVTSNNYIYYMVANCPQLDNWIGSLDNLRNKMITPELKFDELPLDCFVMDGKGTLNISTGEDTSTGGNIATLSFALSRAAVKIRLTVNDNSKKNITNQCQYSFHNYVPTGTSILAESEKYGEGEEQLRQSSEIENPLIYEGMQAVFYSYPNDWFDESLLNDEGIFLDDAIYAKDDLIDENRQTYILLTYDKNQFKVPVNFAISEGNDKVKFTKEDIEKLRDDYYRMHRNYIYNVVVTIDLTAEDITLEDVKILVNVWNEKENMDVIFGSEEEGQ